MEIGTASAARLVTAVDGAVIFRGGHGGLKRFGGLAEAVGLVRRRRLVAGRRRGQRGARRLLGELGNFIFFFAEYVGSAE
jgi:hypothetical protein